MISLQSAFFFLGCFSADLYRISKGERPDGWKVEASWCVGGVRACRFEFYVERSYACLRCANGCETDERKFAGMRLS